MKIRIKTKDDLLKLRQKHKMSQTAFAAKIGISFSSLSKKEIGQREITLLDEFKINAVKW
jgi:transcriptional regulator with XRE-family HTH domain